MKNPKANKGVLLKAPKASTEANAPGVVTPELRVISAEPTPWDTYYAPRTPTRLTAANTYPVDVTVTNTTTTAWPAGERELSYRWAHPDGTDATTTANQLKTDIPALAPGASATVKATVKAPSVDGNRRAGYTLTWDVHNKADDTWLSQKPGIGGLAQQTAVEDPTADRLGLEKQHTYTGKNTGAGSSLMSNLGSGNATWSYNAFANPGRGINTFARFTYNAQDTSDSQLGNGWSAQASGPLRLVIDKNGNTQTYVYELRDSGNRRVKFLTQIKDPSARTTLTLDYYRAGDKTYEYIDDQGEKVSGTDLWNPKIYDHLKSVTDVSGRKVALHYTTKGLLARLTDGAGSAQPKEFTFTYDAAQGTKNAKLTKVTDPRGNGTGLGYSVTADTDYRWSTKTITDRLGETTDFTYKKRTEGGGDETKVTDAEKNTSTYETDDNDRPVKVTNAKSQYTKLTWDADNNVTLLEENNGAKTAYCYDPETGYPLWERSAEENKAGVPSAADCAPGTPGKSPPHATRYEYKPRPDGYSTDLVKKTSAENRTWEFGYDTKGNLKTVTDPKGVASPESGDYTTSYDYDAYGQLTKATDANGNPTLYSDFVASGYPRTTTNALSETSKTTYDELGQVTEVLDPLNKKTTQTYDAFGRPLVSKVPKDQSAGVYITTPAPEYDANDNVTVSTAPNGAVSKATYDKADQVTEATAPKDTATSAERKSVYTYVRPRSRRAWRRPPTRTTTSRRTPTTRSTS
ncbi:hypothetical protein [Streptomyces sp. NPDC059009]|uniref:hypothetical protein n=1 Tax=Streptomyces sp. NPDC059009 TaxID=3346694 RepID=UPI0036B58C3A